MPAPHPPSLEDEIVVDALGAPVGGLSVTSAGGMEQHTTRPHGFDSLVWSIQSNTNVFSPGLTHQIVQYSRNAWFGSFKSRRRRVLSPGERWRPRVHKAVRGWVHPDVVASQTEWVGGCRSFRAHRAPLVRERCISRARCVLNFLGPVGGTDSVPPSAHCQCCIRGWDGLPRTRSNSDCRLLKNAGFCASHNTTLNPQQPPCSRSALPLWTRSPLRA